jgi:phosphate acetyltransferase
MTQGIYIVGAEPRSGKSVIVLGIMEMLSGRMGKIGFFRPVVQDESKPDNITRLMFKRYGLNHPYEKIYGCEYETARDMFSRNREEDLLKLILGKYRDLEKECDLIVCAGTDYEGSAIPLGFDFNAKLANNLGCAVLPVVQGYGRDTMQVVTAARGFL